MLRLLGGDAHGSRFSAVLALAATFDTSLGPRGEVVIVVFGDGSEEMEITLISCQADKSDEAARVITFLN